jgi:DNA-directed RNA polymerase subunit RPC12/RpoP
MEIIFNCPHCDQELAVDGEGAGSEIKCPTCGEEITIPEQPPVRSSTPPPPPPPADGAQNANPINSSAAAKIEMHLKVPMRDKPAEPLVKRTVTALGATPKGSPKQIRVRTIRHDKCIDAGHDKFDEMVSKALVEIGEHNLIGVYPVNYEHFDVQTQKVMTDYGLVIVHRA